MMMVGAGGRAMAAPERRPPRRGWRWAICRWGGAWLAGAPVASATLVNPESLMFFAAFAPQFLSPDAAALPQTAAMTPTFAALGFGNAPVHGLMAGLMAGLMRAASARPARRASAGPAAAAVTARTARA
jgi:threonine/homoserine/homoserine lactone efflux protein